MSNRKGAIHCEEPSSFDNFYAAKKITKFIPTDLEHFHKRCS
jgi:hypothetical protein